MKKEKKELIKLIKSIRLKDISVEHGIESVDIYGSPIPYIRQTGTVQIVIHAHQKTKKRAKT